MKTNGGNRVVRSIINQSVSRKSRKGKVLRKRLIRNNFVGPGASPNRAYGASNGRKGLRIRSGYAASRIEVSPWISNVKKMIRKGKNMQKGFGDSMMNLKRTKAYQIEFNLEKLHEEAQRLEDSLRYIKKVKSELQHKVDSLEDEMARCQRYFEDTENMGIMKYSSGGENLKRNLKKMYQEYRKKMMETKRELLAIKRQPLFSQMSEQQIELEEADLELERLSEFLQHLRENYNFEEVARENEVLEQNILDIIDRNKHLEEEIDELDQMEEILDREDRELKPLEEKYNQLIEERKLAKKEMKFYAQLNEENEADVYAMEASRLQKEALEILEFLGEEEGEGLEHIDFIDSQLGIIQKQMSDEELEATNAQNQEAADRRKSDTSQEMQRLEEEDLQNQQLAEERLVDAEKQKTEVEKKEEGENNRESKIHKGLQPLDMQLLLLLGRKHIDTLKLQGDISTLKVQNVDDISDHIYGMLDSTLLSKEEINLRVRDSMMGSQINPEKVSTLNGKHTGWIENLFMNIEVHTANEEASILEQIKQQNVTEEKLVAVIKLHHLYTNEVKQSFQIQDVTIIAKELGLSEKTDFFLQTHLLTGGWETSVKAIMAYMKGEAPATELKKTIKSPKKISATENKEPPKPEPKPVPKDEVYDSFAEDLDFANTGDLNLNQESDFKDDFDEPKLAQGNTPADNFEDDFYEDGF